MSPASRGDFDKYTHSSKLQQIAWLTALSLTFGGRCRYSVPETTNPAAQGDGIRMQSSSEVESSN